MDIIPTVLSTEKIYITHPAILSADDDADDGETLGSCIECDAIINENAVYGYDSDDNSRTFLCADCLDIYTRTGNSRRATLAQIIARFGTGQGTGQYAYHAIAGGNVRVYELAWDYADGIGYAPGSLSVEVYADARDGAANTAGVRVGRRSDRVLRHDRHERWLDARNSGLMSLEMPQGSARPTFACLIQCMRGFSSMDPTGATRSAPVASTPVAAFSLL